MWARIAILNGQTQAAEVLYLEQNEVEKAIQMYLSLYKWENGNNEWRIKKKKKRIIDFDVTHKIYIAVYRVQQGNFLI